MKERKVCKKYINKNKRVYATIFICLIYDIKFSFAFLFEFIEILF